jgi:hypothetical protein
MTDKQHYDTPVLTVVGTFEDITQASWQGNQLDFAWGIKSSAVHENTFS